MFCNAFTFSKKLLNQRTMRGRVRQDDELRAALEEQIADRNRKLKGRRYFVEPKIGATPTPDTPPTTASAASPSPARELNFSRVSPERQERYIRADGRRSGELSNYSDVQDTKTADLRAALEAQIELKKRRQAEIKERERLASRELLARSSEAAPSGLGQSPAPYGIRSVPVLAPRVDISGGLARSVPDNWHSHEFLDLARKDEEEKQRKHTERMKAEALRADLERQIKEKEDARRSQARSQLETEREYEAKQQRIRETAALNERRRQDEQSKAIQQLAQDNLSMANHRNSPSRVRGVDSSLSTYTNESPPPPISAAARGAAIAAPLPLDLAMQPLGLAAPTPLLDQSGEVRAILTRIHNELLLQRQDFLSPSIFSAIPTSNVARLGLGPFQMSSSPPVDGMQHPLPYFAGVPGELPADRQMVRNGARKYPPHLSPTRFKQPTFSMTDWMSPQLPTVDNDAAAGGAHPGEPITGFDHVSETLKRNQQRLRQLRFAKHNDDVLRIFLQQDNPAAITGSYDLPPPSVLHNTQHLKKS